MADRTEIKVAAAKVRTTLDDLFGDDIDAKKTVLMKVFIEYVLGDDL